VSSDVFIDQKTIDEHIGIQAEHAYDFVLRHINKGAVVNGVYTETRWEYPVIAIREAIRNAVVHRDYSLTGKDIKVAIYDDMVEITSPGKLMPSIDFSELEARQSDIRNKVIAPIFKKLGIIDQWGNGLKLIADELKNYPEIGFKWFEMGLSFQIQFNKKNGMQQPKLTQDSQFGLLLNQSGDQTSDNSNPDDIKTGMKTGMKTGTKTSTKTSTKAGFNHSLTRRQREILLLLIDNNRLTINEISELLNIGRSTIQEHLENLKSNGAIRRIGAAKGGSWQVLIKN
jgi:predicted HTH transcriptional regulator